jgi:tRNA-splicing ligase RtcB
VAAAPARWSGSSTLPRALADEIAGRISFGIGRKNPTPVDHALFDSPVWREVPELTQEVRAKRGPWSLRTRAEQQLGTVGSGNHYVDLLVEPATGDVVLHQ